MVLMYHGVGSPAPHGESYYTVSEDAFAQHMLHLRDRHVVPYAQFLAGHAPPGAVVITFDDGEKSILTQALPVMKAHGLTGTVFVTTAWINAEGYLNADDLRLLLGEGWTVGAHGVTHRFLSELPERDPPYPVPRLEGRELDPLQVQRFLE